MMIRHWKIYGLLFILALPALASPQPTVDHILVLKKEHKLLLLSGDRIVKAYSVALGSGGLAPKQRQGDDKTPEGLYWIDSRNPASRFHLALHISYPDQSDKEQARKRGVSPGGDIMIHGLPNGYGWVGATHRARDWTDGCVAVTNEEMDEIWELVPNGTPIELRP